MRLLFWAPSPSTRRACGGTQTLPLQGAGVGTEHQGTWLWLRTRSSQMTRNTMSPGNEFHSNKEVTGEDEGSGRSSWAMRVRPRSRGPGGVVCPTAGHTRVPTDKCYSAPLTSQTSPLGTWRRKTQLLSGSPHSGSRDNHVKGRTGSSEGGGGCAETQLRPDS